jgi:hypothetical protein
MPQVLRPSDYTNKESNTRSELRTFELNKQVVVYALVGIVLGSWLIACEVNSGLFLKEAAICSFIIVLLVFIKSKSIKRT